LAEQHSNRSVPITYLLVISFIVGLLVIVLHRGYRNAALSILRGDPDLSPIWISNTDYYPEAAKLESEPLDEPD
jgi:hypothetical protein